MDEKDRFNLTIQSGYRLPDYRYDYSVTDYSIIEDIKKTQMEKYSKDMESHVMDIFKRYLEQDVTLNKLREFKLWVADPAGHKMPENLTFGQVHATLDELEERLAQLRESFSHSNFKKD